MAHLAHEVPEGAVAVRCKVQPVVVLRGERQFHEAVGWELGPPRRAHALFEQAAFHMLGKRQELCASAAARGFRDALSFFNQLYLQALLHCVERSSNHSNLQ
jgi:hypothetical protein